MTSRRPLGLAQSADLPVLGAGGFAPIGREPTAAFAASYADTGARSSTAHRYTGDFPNVNEFLTIGRAWARRSAGSRQTAPTGLMLALRLACGNHSVTSISGLPVMSARSIASAASRRRSGVTAA